MDLSMCHLPDEEWTCPCPIPMDSSWSLWRTKFNWNIILSLKNKNTAVRIGHLTSCACANSHLTTQLTGHWLGGAITWIWYVNQSRAIWTKVHMPDQPTTTTTSTTNTTTHVPTHDPHPRPWPPQQHNDHYDYHTATMPTKMQPQQPSQPPQQCWWWWRPHPCPRPWWQVG